MTEELAVAIVVDRRGELALDDDLVIGDAEQGYVEHLADRTRPGKPETRLAWIVSLICEHTFAEVHVDDASGEILHVERGA